MSYAEADLQITEEPVNSVTLDSYIVDIDAKIGTGYIANTAHDIAIYIQLTWGYLPSYVLALNKHYHIA